MPYVKYLMLSSSINLGCEILSVLLQTNNKSKQKKNNNNG